MVAAAVALLVLPGQLSPAAGTPAVEATAHIVGPVRKPIKPNAVKPSKPKAKPRPVAADTTLPNDPLWRDSWSLAKVHAPAAWRVTRGAAETVVAVLDTGIDPNHPDLQGSFVEGWDAVNEDADPNDDHGHGTLVAGVIAARSNNGIGGSRSLLAVLADAGQGDRRKRLRDRRRTSPRGSSGRPTTERA